MRRIWMTILCVALSLIILTISGQARSGENTKAGQITCTGRVIEEQGRSVTGAKVRLLAMFYGDPPTSREAKLAGEVITDADGAFSFSVSAESDVYRYGYIVAEKEPLAIGVGNWPMRQDEEVEIKLGPAKELAGIVVDQSDKPVSGAEVSISILKVGEGEGQTGLAAPVTMKLFKAGTNASGQFVFSGLPADATAELLVKKAGRATISTYRPRQYSGQKLTFAPGQKDIKLVQPVEAKIEGIVVEKSSGKPMAGVEVMVRKEQDLADIRHKPAISNADGAFSINSLAPDRYILELVRPRETQPDWVAAPVEVTTEAGKVVEDIKIELCKGGLLEVLVTEVRSNKPLEGARVYVYDQRHRQSYRGRTGDDGVGRIRLLPGVYQSSDAFKEGFSSFRNQQAITAEEGTTKRLEWQLNALPTVAGIVRDNNGKPVEGATLQVCPMGGRETRSDAEGKYKVSWDLGRAVDERQAPLLVCRYAEGNLALVTTIPEGAKTLDIDLKPGVIVTGKVVNPDSKGIDNARIRIMLRQTMWGSTMSRESIGTDAEGNFEIKAIPIENRYELSFNAVGYGSKRLEIHADEALNNRLKVGEITLPVANLVVSGLVVDTQGNPIANARVESYNFEGGQPGNLRTQSDLQGKFTFDAVCEGELNIRISATHDGKRLSARAITNGGASGIKIVVREGNPVLQYLGTKSYEQIIQSGEKVIAGVALEENGSPVAEVPVGVCCIKRRNENGKFSWSFSSYSKLRDITDKQGRFAIELEEDTEYNLRFSPDDHAAIIVYDIPAGKKDLKVTLPEGGTVNGRLLRLEKGKKIPIPNVEVKIEQTDRTSYTHLGFDRDRTADTDSEGRFRFEHIRTKIRPSSGRSDKDWDYVPRVWQVSYGEISKTVAFYESMVIADFELIVQSEPSLLAGNVLPGFDGIDIDIAAGQTKNKMMLVCFFDMNQRPSRNCIMQIAKKASQIQQNDTIIVAVQASKVEQNALNEWIKKYNIPFPVGAIRGDENEIRSAWGVRALPWLILADREHIVRSEGFTPADLDEKLKQINGN
ncbi:MAG TPA: hypothetical protein DIU00_13920 [Phycisphaerales bacterium]|nr:hypothetical protein [Phycisphaerales bacterium]